MKASNLGPSGPKLTPFLCSERVIIANKAPHPKEFAEI